MPLRRFRLPLPELPPIERLVRAIRAIDRRIEQARCANQPAPLSAYRARSILQEALQRCLEAGDPVQATAHRLCRALPEPPEANAPATDREPQDFRGCRNVTLKTDLPARECSHDRHANEGKSMAYDWTGEATRKRNRLKVVSAVFVSLIIVVALPIAVTPFL
ncbi:hypothetical protein GB928_019900 [Shinella curvata]|uniref:Uncharacterized protein n=1 Tax=Shinella curvata TaxID=1817964 RepID=A0ABT8XI87_9HYPH|nr:hypothetical protein [Shinella curvata]MCJ8055938.1 hypothetical protein [Shinella curvata]MDO6123461.1 hypothetical protein [Shinella curvata]